MSGVGKLIWRVSWLSSDNEMNVNRQHVLRRSVLAARCAARPGGKLFTRRYTTEDTEESAPLTDYPKVPDVSRQYLPPTGWHDNLMRRNFGDAVSGSFFTLCSCSFDSVALAA
jgi:hypothetical protein